jgi:cell division protein FtsN
MIYDFSLDRKAVVLVLAGSFLLVALVFIAGLMVGAHWGANPDETGPVARTTPRRPVLASDVSSEEDEDEPPRRSGLREEVLSDGAVAPDETTGSAKPGGAAPPAADEREHPAQGVVTDPDPKVIQKGGADATEAPSRYNETAAARTAYSVQVGVFLEEKEAQWFVEELEGKGYTPTIFAGSDADDRPWYAVRIGIYSDKAEATRAASNFSKQESVKAVVRPAGSL